MRRQAGLLCSALFLVLAACVVGTGAVALVNPELVQAESEEDLVVEVLESASAMDGTVETVRMVVRVIEVHRTSSAVAVGDTLPIEYDRDTAKIEEITRWLEEKAKEPGWAGDTPRFLPAAPSAGSRMRAYLDLVRGHGHLVYVPGAAQYSFEPQ